MVPRAGRQRSGHGLVAPAGEGQLQLWCGTERRVWVEALYPGAVFEPDYRLPAGAKIAVRTSDRQRRADGAEADVAAATGRPRPPGAHRPGDRGPAGRSDVASPRAGSWSGWRDWRQRASPCAGGFDPALGTEEQWCARHLLARLHSYSQNRLRREIEPVTAQDFMRFLLRWQHVAPGTRRQGRAGLLAVDRTIAGLRAGRRRLGGSGPLCPGRGLPATVAGGPLPVRRS